MNAPGVYSKQYGSYKRRLTLSPIFNPNDFNSFPLAGDNPIPPSPFPANAIPCAKAQFLEK